MMQNRHPILASLGRPGKTPSRSMRAALCLLLALCNVLVASPAHAQWFDWGGTHTAATQPSASALTAEVQNQPLRPYTVPSLPELQPLAEKAIQQSYWSLASFYIKLLAPSAPDEAQLLTARMKTRQGDYHDALNALQSLHLHPSPQQQEASTLHGQLLLTLAEIAQLEKRPADAEQYLRTYLREHKQGNDPHFDRLMRQQLVLSRPDQADSLRKSDQPLRLGLLVPLTGPLKDIGAAMQKAALLALYSQPMDTIELYPEDTQGTAAGAQAAFQHAVDNGVDIVLGPLLSGSVSAIAPFSRAADRPVIAFSSDATVAAENVWLLSYNPAEQARLMARQGVAAGKHTFAALLPDNAYGQDMLAAFADELKQLGAKLDVYAFYDPNKADLTPALRTLVRMEESERSRNREIKGLEKEYAVLAGAMEDASLTRLKELRKTEAQPDVRYDALFVPASDQIMPQIAPQLAFYDTDSSHVLLLGSARWQGAGLLKGNGEYLRGALFPAPDSQSFDAFKKMYVKTYKQSPHPLSALSYDAVKLVISLALTGLQNGRDLKHYLQRDNGFHGASGPFRFNPKGFAEHGYEIDRVRGRTTSIITPAPKLLPPTEVENVRQRQNGWGGSVFGSRYQPSSLDALP